MLLNETSVKIRPRSAWEALDLGCLLARRHAGVLMLSWAALTLPVFLILSIVLWRHPTLSLLLFWWFKPLYERLPLFILSRALFGETPTLRQSFHALPAVLRPQWLATVTWRRFSLTRSFDLPVLQLEGLSGRERRERLSVLGRRNGRAATWLTIVGMHLEGALSLGLLGLMYFFIPAPLLADLSWRELIGQGGSETFWLEHLSNLLYALVLVFWEPIYIASGFSLYLNRRTVLEAWDIELSFRRLQARLSTLLLPLLIGLGLLFMTSSEAIWAAENAATAEAKPEHLRLLNQSLSSQAASQRIGEILDQPPFRHEETATRWRLGAENSQADSGWLADLLESLSRTGGNSRARDLPAILVEALLWMVLFGGIAVLCWRYREWLRLYGGRLRPAPRRRQVPPRVLFGLAVTPESLPSDIAGEVERLWATQPRLALGLLYRALLSRLLHERQLPLKAAHTEQEALQLIAAMEQPALMAFATELTLHWQNVAYGHQAPPVASLGKLCSAWRELFDQESAL